MSDSAVTGPQQFLDQERVKEAERRRIANDLHDELGSHLCALKMALAQLALQLPKQDVKLQQQAHYADTLVDGAIDAMHGIIDDLHPAVLDLGLPAALEWLAQTFTRHTNVAYRVIDADNMPSPPLNAFQSISLYRIVREALHNISRHASATRADITLRQSVSQLTLDIVDNGAGRAERLLQAAAGRAESSGIRSMQRRAAAIGGSLAFLQAPGRGILLQVVVPLSPDEALSNPIK